MNKIYGIDLGTTYSCIAVVDDHGLQTVIPNAENELTTPSVVYFEESGDIIVGQSAKELNKLNPERVIEAVKRHMGEDGWSVAIDGKSYTPQMISSFILRKVVADAEQVTGDVIKDVVITCPAYFSVAEREATRQAGELAELVVHGIVSEPTAAAFSFADGMPVKETLLVYDLGGGTFDVTLVEGASRKVLAVDGDKGLGGKDWDNQIVEFWLSEFETQTGVPAASLRGDLDAFQSLVNDAEAAKKRLSTSERHQIRIRHEGVSANIELTREKFDEFTAHLLVSTLQRSRAVMKMAEDKGCLKIDAILLVGGSTFMPQVEQALTTEFGLPLKRKNPNQIVALGAALCGQRAALEEIFVASGGATGAGGAELDLSGAEQRKALDEAAAALGMDRRRVEELLSSPIVDVTPKSFGLRVVDPKGGFYVDNIILRNGKIPAELTKQYYSQSETDCLMLKAFENLDDSGGRVSVEDCEPLGELAMVFPRRVQANHPIQVTFRFTPDGLLRLRAQDTDTGTTIEGEFRSGSVMSPAEMETSRQRLADIRVG